MSSSDREEWLVGTLLLLLLLLEGVVASLLSDNTSSIGVAIPKGHRLSMRISLDSKKTYRSCPMFPKVSCPPSRFSNKPASFACSWSALLGCLPILGVLDAPLGGRGAGDDVEGEGEVKDGADELAYVPWRLKEGAEDGAGDALLG